MTTVAAGPVTAAELEQLAGDGVRRELVDGELREMAPSGFDHGQVTARLAYLLVHHVRTGRLEGYVLGAETGFRLSRDPDTVRAPDAAFVAAARITPGTGTRGFAELAPDLAVEVVSPSDRAADVVAKALGWLAAGSRLVWVVYPDQRLVAVFEGASSMHLRPGAVLDGGDVLPGLRLPVADLFD